jgi:hypothetical protein
MKAGDVVNGYTILEDFRVVGAGLSKWTFAAKDGREYFIKEFLSPTYPDETRRAAPRRRCESAGAARRSSATSGAFRRPWHQSRASAAT